MTSQPTRIDLAYTALRQAIIEQAILPGTKLPEDEIGAHFGMSRTLVRSTLARLKSEGLVDIRPKRTATVAQPSLDEAREVFELRRALEAEVIRLVARNWSAEFGAELEGHVRAEDAAKARRDERVSIRLAGEFHLKLAELAGNTLLAKFVAEVVSRCSLILALYGRPHSSDCAVNEHSEIIAALRAGDVARATDLMEHHIGSVESRALLGSQPANRDLSAILGRYRDELTDKAMAAIPLKKPRRRAGS